MSNIETFELLGTQVSAVTLDRAAAFIEERVERRDPTLVCVCSVNMIMTARRDPVLRSALEAAGLVSPDGFPVTKIGQRRAVGRVGRVRGTDLMLEACRRAASNGGAIYLYGGAPGVPERIADRLRAHNPSLRIAGVESPPFRPLSEDEKQETVARINQSGADIVWVGLGCPRQEAWMLEFRPRLTAPVLVGVGAAFDFLAGTTRMAPRWVQRIGAEWLWRFLHQPRRMWRRVFVEGPAFLALAAREEWSRRRTLRIRNRQLTAASGVNR